MLDRSKQIIKTVADDNQLEQHKLRKESHTQWNKIRKYQAEKLHKKELQAFVLYGVFYKNSLCTLFTCKGRKLFYHEILEHRKVFVAGCRNDAHTDRLFFKMSCLLMKFFLVESVLLNVHNTHVWSNENPYATISFNHQHRFHVNIWAGIVEDYGRFVSPVLKRDAPRTAWRHPPQC